MIARKRRFCYTDVSDFTDFQGIGNDPIYKRYDSVYAVIKQHIDEPYRSFLAEPEYSMEDDKIFWYTEEWGNSMPPVKMKNIDDEVTLEKCRKLLHDTVTHYHDIITSLSGEKKTILESAVKYIDEDFVYYVENRIVLAIWGMRPDKNRHDPTGIVIHDIDLTEYCALVFNAGKHGELVNKLEAKIKRRKGSKLSAKDLPKIKSVEGYEFERWNPEPIGWEVNGNLSFNAVYRTVEIPKKICHIQFKANDYCSIDGRTEYTVEEGSILSNTQIPYVVVKEGYVFIGWDKDIQSPINEDMVFHAITQEAVPETCHVKFVGHDGCELLGKLEFDIPKGAVLTEDLVPQIACKSGYSFKQWSNELNVPIMHDQVFYAECEVVKPKDITVNFNAGEHGILSGCTYLKLPEGSILSLSQIPAVKAHAGYKFKGWDRNPVDITLNDDITFNAIYEETSSWWKRMLGGMSIGGCLWRFIVFLLLLLLFLFLLSLLRKCDGQRIVSPDDMTNGPAMVEIGDSVNSSFKDNPGFADDGQIGNVPSTPIDNPDLGEGVNPGNGGNDYHVGVFPPNPDYPPIDNPDNPQGPQIIPNVINVFFTEDNANLNAFAKDFRDIYPDTQKYQLDYDDLVKRVSIMMPVEERVTLKSEIEQKLGEKYSFFIVDESAIMQNAVVQNAGIRGENEENAGWHLIAVNAPKAWNMTIGNPDVTVAVVDDGLDITHDFFKNKLVHPYNVFTKSDALTNGTGHGTHTAGLAVGLVRQDGKAAGIAPGCKLMPVQVFKDNQSTLSAEISGIAYAIHNGADVVNVSMGGNYSGFRNLSDEEQMAVARQKGKLEELLWQKIFRMAKAKNTVIVFSAGNDNVISYLNPQNRPDSLITVTAVNPQLKKSIFGDTGAGSNHGLGSKIAAPGSEIYSSVPVNSYAIMEGTSMAAPIVSGVVALLKSVKRDLTVGETLKILTQSGKRLSDTSLGPLVQADRALILLQTGKLPPEENDNDGQNNDYSRPDYSDIFRQIAEHQRAIMELVRQLPPEEQERYK